MNEQTGEVTTPQGSATLFAKMARAMGKMSRLKKTGKHPTQGYPFATDADVSDLVREALAEEGIAFLPAMTGVNPVQVGQTKYQQPIFRNYASFVFTFACSETGATYSCAWQSEADDSSDKGINKTATAAVKYFLLKTFLISTGDTVDPDASPDYEHAHPQAKQSKPSNGTRPAPPTQPAPDTSQNGANKAAMPKATKTPPAPVVKNDTKIEMLDRVTVEKFGRDNRRMKTSTGSYSYTRAPFTEAGIDTELWTEPGLYMFGKPFNVISIWHQPEDAKSQAYWRVDRLEAVGEAEAELFGQAPVIEGDF